MKKEMKKTIVGLYREKYGAVEDEDQKDVVRYAPDSFRLKESPAKWILAFQSKHGVVMEKKSEDSGDSDMIFSNDNEKAEKKEVIKYRDDRKLSSKVFDEFMTGDIQNIHNMEQQREKEEMKARIYSPYPISRFMRTPVSKKGSDSIEYLSYIKKKNRAIEDFKEFEKIPPMIKSTDNGPIAIRDMNQVFADSIKVRYRSTDRFKRVNK